MIYQPFSLLMISIFLTVTAHLLLKKGITLIGKLEFSFVNLVGLISQIFQNIYLLLGIFFFGVAFLFWLFALSKIQLNFMYPISVGVSFTLITVASWFLFGEGLSFYQILGVVFIIFGVFFLAMKI